jgi:hypothetical protein
MGERDSVTKTFSVTRRTIGSGTMGERDSVAQLVRPRES